MVDEGGSARRGAAIGACICSGFGAGWFGWSQGYDPRGLRAVSGIGIGVAMAVCAFAVYTLARARRAAGADGRGRGDSDWTAQTRRRYRIIVFVEFASIAVGAVVLGVLRHPSWIPVWTSIVVAVHFYPLADLFRVREMKRLATCMLLVTALAVAAVAAGARVPAGSLTCLGAGCVLLYGATSALIRSRIPAASGT